MSMDKKITLFAEPSTKVYPFKQFSRVLVSAIVTDPPSKVNVGMYLSAPGKCKQLICNYLNLFHIEILHILLH